MHMYIYCPSAELNFFYGHGKEPPVQCDCMYILVLQVHCLIVSLYITCNSCVCKHADIS